MASLNMYRTHTLLSDRAVYSTADREKEGVFAQPPLVLSDVQIECCYKFLKKKNSSLLAKNVPYINTHRLQHFDFYLWDTISLHNSMMEALYTYISMASFS